MSSSQDVDNVSHSNYKSMFHLVTRSLHIMGSEVPLFWYFHEFQDKFAKEYEDTEKNEKQNRIQR